MVIVGVDLWVFGGWRNVGEGTGDLPASDKSFSLDVATFGHDVDWPDLGITVFTRIFDDNVIKVSANVDWHWGIRLCSQPFLPCTLTITDDAQSDAMRRAR